MNIKKIFLVALLLGTVVACKEDPVACTMEFRTVTVTVTGPALTSYYTLRTATGDTIRISQENVGGMAGVYPILDDSFQSVIEGRTENFVFKGFINDSLVVNQSYGIAADKCHINYVSGNLNVTL
ncbi:MAG: hypothetical protein Q8J69_13660 [Sphingobacteriaceae bacterium]|nr:hypothetical protein [Sphingobacteriaceae bacterium]